MKEFIVQNFFKIQIGLSAFLILLWMRSSLKDASRSNFKVREADRNLKFDRGGAAAESANAKLKPTVFQLTGIRIDGKSHEILGVSATASENEIQKAYRELMKRYHPDQIGRPGTREWQDAQRIAEAINTARNDLLSRAKKR